MTEADGPAGQAADLVLAGGGVKGIALVGAVESLAAAGYRFPRVAGSSAGAIVAALVAAGLPAERMATVVRSLDYRKFRDSGGLDRVPLVGAALSLWFEDGVYEGSYLREWLGNELAALGVETFADLRDNDPGGDPTRAPDQRYRLVVTATDVTRGLLLRLPWDYRPLFGLDPDRQLVVDAVRASASIPFFFEPVTLTDERSGQTDTLVDGGVLSNFPIDTFDRCDGQPPRWPTFGVTLDPALPTADAQLLPFSAFPVPRPVRLVEELVATVIVGHDQTALARPCTRDRVIRVDTDSISFVDFSLTSGQQELLYQNGQHAAEAFLARWNWPDYLRRCGARPSA